MKSILKRIASVFLLGRIVWSVPKGTGIYMTFDDGPHRKNNERILRSLREEKCTATFFLLGNSAAKQQQLVRNIHSAGHVIANHGMTHQHRRDHSTKSFVAEVQECQEILETCAEGKRLKKLFRPPYGELRLLDAILLMILGYQIIMWSTDSEDSFIENTHDMLVRFDEMILNRGDILLFHEDSTLTAALLPQIISRLRSRGIEFSAF